MLKKGILRFSFYWILALACALPSVFLVVYCGYDAKNVLSILGLSFSFIAIIVSLSAFSPRLSALLLTIFALLVPFELWMILYYENTLDSNYLGIIFESNQTESFDFFIHLLPFWPLLIFMGIFVLSVLALMFPYKLKKQAAQIAFFLGAILLVGLVFIYQNLAAKEKEAELNYATNKFNFLANDTDAELIIRQSYPTGLLFSVQDYFYQRQELRDVLEFHRDYKFGAKVVEHPEKRQIYILVIGESSSYRHWGINGYERNTTPLLAQRNDLINFKDMHTIEVITRMAVPLIVSRKPYTSAEPIFEEASIVTYFKELGFRTTWISLQAQYGFHDSPISVTAFEANDTVFLNPVSYRFGGKYDYEALPYIKEAIDKNDENLFIVVHTLGSHIDFIDRYDDSMRVFTPDLEHEKKGGLWTFKFSPALVNAYDNSIIATDYFLANLIQMMDEDVDSDSWIFYISDHGEALQDDCTQRLGHGFVAPTVNHVPAVFWASKGYQETYPDKIRAMQENTGKVVSSTMMFHTMVGLSGGVIPTESRQGYDMTKEDIVVPEDRVFAAENELFTHFCKE